MEGEGPKTDEFYSGTLKNSSASVISFFNQKTFLELYTNCQLLKFTSSDKTQPRIKWSHTDCVSLSVADTGMVGWPHMLGDFSEKTRSPLPTLSATPPSPHVGRSDNQADGQARGGGATSPSKSIRLKRLNSAQQHTVYSMCQTPEGVKYRCTACSRCFNLKCTLLRHVRHQHQGRFVPHPCGQCGQVFKRTDHLKVHMKKIHNISSSSRQRNLAFNLSTNPAESATVAAAVASMAHQQPVPPQPDFHRPTPPIPANSSA